MEQIRLDKKRIFAPSSEAHLLQAQLFDELSIKDDLSEESPDEQTVTYTRKRKNSPRQPLPDNLERLTTHLDIDEADKVCPCCNKSRTHMGDVVHEELEVIAMKLVVRQTIRPKYVCNSKQCHDETICIPALPARLLPHSNASPSLVADIITKKYIDHLPLYRQEQQWMRLSIDLPRSQMCNWLMNVGKQCEPLYEVLKEPIINYDISHADETTVQVLNEPERTNTQKSYIWCYKGGPPETPVACFEYQSNRRAENAATFFEDYEGYIHSDAYNGYDWINADKQYKQIHLYCMAHARRPFAELVKMTATPGVSHQAIRYFEQLYAIEKQARQDQLDPCARFLLRLEKSKPILDQLFHLLKAKAPGVPPSSKLGLAINYMLTREEGFYTFLYDGRLEIDNNSLENLIRPFAIGRKNWLFLGSPRGAKTACIFYSLIQACKLNDIEPFAYFNAMLRLLPACKTKDDFRKLLPWVLCKK